MFLFKAGYMCDIPYGLMYRTLNHRVPVNLSHNVPAYIPAHLQVFLTSSIDLMSNINFILKLQHAKLRLIKNI